MERFWSKVDKSDKCWIWTANKFLSGYGSFWLNGKHVYTHRVAYELYNGAIPKGLVIDHLCRNRDCVNPEHLELVSIGENVRRGNSGKWQKDKTHCKNGHEFTRENTILEKRGGRTCRICKNHRNKVYRNKNKTKSVS